MTSRVGRKLHEENEWGWHEILLNHIWHELKVLVWQKTEDATKRHPKNYPELFIPDFLEKYQPKKETEAEAHDLEDIKSILSRPRQSATLESNEQEC